MEKDEDKKKQPEEMFFTAGDWIEEDSILKRKILLIGDVDDGMAAYVTNLLQLFAAAKHPAYMYICSGGGDLPAGYSIIDQMILSPFPVVTIVRGQAVSMGAIIAAYGTKGHRYITPNSYMMIHPMSIVSGIEPVHSFKKSADYMSNDYLTKVKDLSRRTKLRYRKLLGLIQDVHWMNPKEAIKIGLVDDIWTPKHEAIVNKRVKMK